jgi:hypothetical protein
MGFTAPAARATDFLITAPIWNAEHVDNWNTAVMHLIARKTADESVTSSTVLQSDDHLFLTVGANEVWLLQLFFIWTSTAADGKMSWQFPSGEMFTALNAFTSGGVWGSIAQHTASDTGQVTVLGTAKRAFSMNAWYLGGGTGGTVTLRWAQNASSGTPTTIHTNSTLFGLKLA